MRIPSEGVGVCQYESGDFPFVELRITEPEPKQPSPITADEPTQ